MATAKKIGAEHPYPHFAYAVRALGRTIPVIAMTMGVSERSVKEYLRGTALPRVEVVKRIPALDTALTLDIAPRCTDSVNSVAFIAKNSS